MLGALTFYDSGLRHLSAYATDARAAGLAARGAIAARPPRRRRVRARRLILFADPTLATSTRLLAATVTAAAARPDMEVAAIVEVTREPRRRLRLARSLAGLGVRGAFNLNTAAVPSVPPLLGTCAALARRHRIRLLGSRERGVNDAAVVREIRRLAPDAALSLMVPEIFHGPLLAACGVPINYHDGLLPAYRGVAATGWSIYEGAPRSGFSFHRMTEEVDGGPLLLQASMPIPPGCAAAQLERAKTRLACSLIERVLELLARGAECYEQEGRQSSFSRADLRAIRTVEDPSALRLDELERRLRCFETLELPLAGGALATALRRVARRPRDAALAFETADGVAVEVTRIAHLPPLVHRSLRVAGARPRG